MARRGAALARRRRTLRRAAAQLLSTVAGVGRATFNDPRTRRRAHRRAPQRPGPRTPMASILSASLRQCRKTRESIRARGPGRRLARAASARPREYDTEPMICTSARAASRATAVSAGSRSRGSTHAPGVRSRVDALAVADVVEERGDATTRAARAPTSA